MTIIDALVVKLGLDSSDLDKKSSSASGKLKDIETQGGKTEKGVKKLGATSKESASSVETLTSSFAKLLSVLGGAYAIKAFASDMINSSAAVDRLSKNLNVGAGEITAWGNAAEQLGGSAKGVQTSMSMLSKAQTDIQLTGESGVIPYFNYLGVSLADASGKARKVTDVLTDLAGAAEGKDRRQMANIFATMGFDQDTINLLLMGRKELDITLAHQKAYAEQVGKFAPVATKLQRGLVDIKQSFTLLGLNILQSAAPALEKVLGILSKLGSFAQQHTQFFKDLGIALGVIGAGLGVIALVTSPITLTVFAIGALATAIALLLDDYQTWRAGGKSLIPWGQWKTEIDAAKAGITELKKIAITAFDAIITAARVAWDAIHGNWGALKKDLATGTQKMNKAIGLQAGPDEAHDQNAKKLDKVVKAVPGALRSFWGTDTPAPAGQKTVPQAIAQVEGFNAKGKKPNRPQRDHNPGDIEYGDFAKTHGATGSDGRFAIFPDDATGFAALTALLQSKNYRNLTIPQAINRFAPPNENNTAGYAASVMKATGTNKTTTLAQALNGIQGAANSARLAGQNRPSSTANDNRVSNHIENVNITAPSGDSRDIAQAFRTGLEGLFPATAAVGVR